MEAERDWWRRAVLMLRYPREVFRTLRDDSAEKAADRQDVVVTLAFIGGVAAALGAAAEGLEDLDGLEALIWIFFTGFSFGFVGYWLLGWALAFVVRRLGGGGSSRRVRHVLAYSLPPLVLALPAWLIFEPLQIVLAGWSVGLLVLGLVVVYRWSVVRAASATLLAGVWLATLAVGLWSVLVLLGRLG